MVYLKKNEFVVWKMTKQIWLILYEQLQVWKFAFWWVCFVQSIWSFSWKNKEELCFMTLKSDPKKSSFLRNMDFLSDAIDLKQSVEGTLKV